MSLAGHTVNEFLEIHGHFTGTPEVLFFSIFA